MAAGSAAVAISAAAAAQAAQARKEACAALVRGYQHDRATVAEAQEYAGCIGRLYPANFTPEAAFVMKAAVLLLLLSFFCGGVWGCLADWGCRRIEGAVMGSLGGLGACLGVLLVIGGVFAGVKFLLS